MMAPDTQFWFNWSVGFLTAAGTVGAVIAALFGEPIRRRLAPPNLNIELSTAPGEGEKAATLLTYPTRAKPIQPRTTVSRWRHIKVENRRRGYTTATEVRVWMVELKVQNNAGSWDTQWIGELPFGWKDQQVKLPALSMGQPDEADLCCVIKDYTGVGKHALQLKPVIQKYPPQTEWNGECHIQVKFQARSTECTSNIITIQIDWDGTWDDDDARMKQHHLQIKPV